MTNESEDALYEMAEQAWNECWPDEPTMGAYAKRNLKYKAEYRAWLIRAFTNIVNEYDGSACYIAEHIGELSSEWIEKRAHAILEDAREAEAQARADSREDW